MKNLVTVSSVFVNSLIFVVVFYSVDSLALAGFENQPMQNTVPCSQQLSV